MSDLLTALLLLTIELLGHQSFQVREYAMTSLKGNRLSAQLVYQASQEHTDLEVRLRCRELLKSTCFLAEFYGGHPDGSWHKQFYVMFEKDGSMPKIVLFQGWEYHWYYDVSYYYYNRVK